ILDLVPERQPEKLAVLAKIRALLDDDALDALDAKERAELRELRPPDDLAPITIEGLPPALKERLTERDGKIGYLISIRPAAQLDEWDGRDLIRFGNAVRRLVLHGAPVRGPDGAWQHGPTETVTTSGTSVIFADIVESIERDGPIVTTIAAAGLIAMVLLLVGRNRRAAAVLISTAAGSLLMVATCAVLGLKVNFLDFVALPITLGLGIDYAINIAHRHDEEELPDPLTTLRTSGSAVFVCSLTTIIGYGSLLVSDNLAIRGFGVASLIGEIACVLTALVLVPAILAIDR
ncbi:MAG TPA: MMPL family transporter, partial [Kofleriaceae bacterium]|nr:MMPL family transporter [Kofleriaceae bacterium]